MGSVRAFKRLKAGISSSVSSTSSTLGGRGRRANSCGMDGFWTGRAVGVGTLEGPAGVTVREARGLFFDLGLDGACRKSSGMSFQLSIADGTAVEAEGTRAGAVADLGGGGGRFGVGFVIGGGLVGWSFGTVAVGFLSQLFNEDCSISRC